MAGPWRARFLRKAEAIAASVACGLTPADGGSEDLFAAFAEDPAAAYAGLGYLPFVTWRRQDADAVCGVFMLCPICGALYNIRLRPDPRSPRSEVWGWNGSMDAPTLSPSLHATIQKGCCGGHYWLRDGILTDCGGHRPL